MQIWRALLFVVTAGLSFAASASHIPVTACSALTQEQVQRSLGRSVSKGVEQNAASQSTCDFNARSGLLSLSIHNVDAAVEVEQQQAGLKAAFPSAKFRAATIGEMTGFFMDLPEVGTQLHVVSLPGKYVMISVFGFGEGADITPAVQAIAKSVIARIAERSGN